MQNLGGKQSVLLGIRNSQSSYLVITEQAVSALYIKLLQNDRFRPPLVYPFAASGPPLSESGYIAFMVTSSQRRRM